MVTAALWLAAASSVIICFSAIAAKALRQFSRHTLGEICKRHDSVGRLGEILRWHEPVAVAAEALQVLATGLFVYCGGYLIWQQGGWSEPRVWLYGLAGVVVLLMSEIWIPSAVVRIWAESIVFRSWTFWRLVERALVPLGYVAHLVNTLIHRAAGRTPEVRTEESFEEEIRTIVSEGHREGLLEEDEREMIEGVIEMGDAAVSEIMTPRTDMVCMNVALTPQEVLEFVMEAGHSRIPVYDKNRDDIVGVLYAKDLLFDIARNGGSQRSVAQIMRKPFFVPETKPVKALLQEFQNTRNHMAVVLDEYGGVSGLVTIEDVLEEIVGEIVDEHDEDVEEPIKEVDERTSEVLARVHIDELNERLGLELTEDGDFDTVGGLVFSELGHIPEAGEQLICGNARITVLAATPRRVERVRIERLDEMQRQPA